MNCKKCNAHLEPDEMFCANCGEKNPDYKPAGESAFDGYDEGKKKKKKPVALTVGVLAAVAVAGAVFAGAGVVKSIFTSPKDQFKAAIQKESDSVIGYVGKSIDRMKERYKSYKDGYNTNGIMSLELSDKGKDFLTSELPYSMDDINWFDSAQIEYNGNITLDDMGIELNMKLNKKNLFKIDTYMSDKNIQVKLPEYSDNVLTFDTNKLSGNIGHMGRFNAFETLGMNAMFAEALPDSAKLKKITDKYTKIFLENIDNVERSSDSVEAQDVRVKATKLTAHISGDKLKDIKKDILNKALEDDELKEVIINCGDAYGKLSDNGISGKDAYDEFKSIAELEREYADSEQFNDLECSVWVSGKKVVAKELVVDNQTIMEYKTPVNGSKLGVEINISDGYNTASLTGRGKMKNSVLIGDFDITYSGQTLSIGVNRIDFKKLKDGYMDMDFDVAAVTDSDIADYSVGVIIQEDTKKSSVILSLMKDDDSLLRFAIDDATGKFKKPNELDGKKLDFAEDTDLHEYVESFDKDKLTDRLRQAGVPSEYVDELEDEIK
ncbi:MAG: zinc ribbon domain-containing protein [Lachnoanaerobaculum saburreum]